jgi:hypothetical protein
MSTCGVVSKWLHGRQIPSIAGLKLSARQLDELQAEIARYLRLHADASPPLVPTSHSSVGTSPVA